MQIITYDMAYSLYPDATFEDKTSLWLAGTPTPDLTMRHSECIGKYTLRGFRFIAETLPANQEQYVIDTQRRLTDRHTWRIELDTTGIALRQPITPTSPLINCDPVVHSSWCLQSSPNPHAMQYTVFRNYCLRYEYVASCRSQINHYQSYFGKQETLEKLKMNLGTLSDESEEAQNLITWCVII